MRDIKLLHTYGHHWNLEWQVWWGGTLLLHTQDKAQAKEAFERYKKNPPMIFKIPAEDAIKMWN